MYGSKLKEFNTRLQEGLHDTEVERDEANSQRLRALDQEQRALRQEGMARRNLYAAHLNLAQRDWDTDNLVRVLDLLNAHRPTPGQEDERTFEWYLFWRLCHRDRVTLLDHQDVVTSVAFSPDGKLLVSTAANGTVKLRDPATGHELASLGRFAESVSTAAFSPDSKNLAILDVGGRITLWDVAKKEKRATAPGQDRLVTCMAFSVDGTTLAIGGQTDAVTLWNTTTGKSTTLQGSHGWVNAVAYSPDGKLLAAGGEFEGVGQVIVWELATGQKRSMKRLPESNSHVRLPPEEVWTRNFLVGMGSIKSLAFSPDSKFLAGGFGFSIDNGNGETSLRVWKVATGELQSVPRGHREAVLSLAFAPNGKTLASSSSDGTIRLWDPETSQEKAIFRGHKSHVMAVAFAPDGKTLATASFDRSLKLWNAIPEQERNTLRGGQLGVTGLAFSQDDRTLATIGFDGTTKLWDVDSGSTSATLVEKTPGRSLAFAPDGKTLAIGSQKVVQLWDLGAKKVRQALRGHTGEIYCTVFAPDGRTLATGSQDQNVILWDANTWEQRSTIRDHPTSVVYLAFTRDGKTLAVGSTNELRLWDLATERVRLEISKLSGPISSVALSPDGTRLAAAHVDRQNKQYPAVVTLWDAATGQVVATLKGHKGMIWCVTFSPDGKTLATGSHDESVKLWDPVTGEERATLKGHTAPVRALAFSHDNKILASGSGAPVPLLNRAGEVILWRAAAKEEVATHVE